MTSSSQPLGQGGLRLEQTADETTSQVRVCPTRVGQPPVQPQADDVAQVDERLTVVAPADLGDAAVGQQNGFFDCDLSFDSDHGHGVLLVVMAKVLWRRALL